MVYGDVQAAGIDTLVRGHLEGQDVVGVAGKDRILHFQIAVVGVCGGVHDDVEGVATCGAEGIELGYGGLVDGGAVALEADAMAEAVAYLGVLHAELGTAGGNAVALYVVDGGVREREAGLIELHGGGGAVYVGELYDVVVR